MNIEYFFVFQLKERAMTEMGVSEESDVKRVRFTGNHMSVASEFSGWIAQNPYIKIHAIDHFPAGDGIIKVTIYYEELPVA